MTVSEPDPTPVDPFMTTHAMPPALPAEPAYPAYPPAEPAYHYAEPVSPVAPPPMEAAPPAVPAPPLPIVARVGEISVSSTTIYTPTGEMPLRGSQWVVTDQWQAHSKIPVWAIVLCILTFFCIPIFNFLFLLAKETYYTGMVVVSVTSAGRHYVARIPVNSQVQVANLQSQVNYIRSLAAL
ncbi:hypothetical protein HDA40_003523 [Hamadaea flava]|uniref:Uncharacterized protein n=1 Tax=Hamadaea flava TaxID=1742688 RepID=A0ABV8LJL6_9ACTN|nr:hypothetical protein [Hamadaea flava]MCP2325016.1 hypothetical protein [Hamadaea flava]